MEIIKLETFYKMEFKQKIKELKELANLISQKNITQLEFIQMIKNEF